jgi:hypothetical protein
MNLNCRADNLLRQFGQQLFLRALSVSAVSHTEVFRIEKFLRYIGESFFHAAEVKQTANEDRYRDER